MPSLQKINIQQNVHSDEIQDIITKVPSWLLRWGIMLLFAVIILVTMLSSFIKYPDVVRTTMEIDTLGNNQFYGKMIIPQDKLDRVNEGQEVLIKLKRYPFEEYGIIKGRIKHIDDLTYKSHYFLSNVDFNNSLSPLLNHIHLKKGMVADAEIITQEATLLQRLTKNIFKTINIK